MTTQLLNWVMAELSFKRIKIVSTSKKHFFIIEEVIHARDESGFIISPFYSLEIDGKTERGFTQIDYAKDFCQKIADKE